MGKKIEKRPIPAYMVTLGDMWSLLLTFFIMIVALSEVDATKFKKIKGSIKNSFGFQKTYIFHESPKGSSHIKQEQAMISPPSASDSSMNQSAADPQLEAMRKEREKSKRLKEINDEKVFKRNLASVYRALKPEIDAGKVEIAKKDKDVIIRISEQASFRSGSAMLTREFKPLVDKLSKVMDDVTGNVRIGGHTDDQPLHSQEFRSNWELSSARAAAVGQALIETSNIPENRFILEAYGASRPYVSNSSPYNRSKNRRVEIIISKP